MPRPGTRSSLPMRPGTSCSNGVQTHYSDSVLNTYLFNPDEYFGLYGQDGLPAGKESTIAVCQMEGSLGTRKETLAALRQMIDGLDSPFEVLVLPELALSGPVTTDSQARALAEVLRDSESVKLADRLGPRLRRLYSNQHRRARLRANVQHGLAGRPGRTGWKLPQGASVDG